MKHWIGLFAVLLVMTAAALIVSHGIQRRHHEPQPTLARPLDHWPTQADLDRLESVKGKTRIETIKILGHPATVAIREDGSERWDYPWCAACSVWFRNGVVVETFYTGGW
jgi:hypothetical protein